MYNTICFYNIYDCCITYCYSALYIYTRTGSLLMWHGEKSICIAIIKVMLESTIDLTIITSYSKMKITTTRKHNKGKVQL